MQVKLLRRLESELESGDVETFATAARELAEAFGSVSATAVGAVADVAVEQPARRGPAAADAPPARPAARDAPPLRAPVRDGGDRRRGAGGEERRLQRRPRRRRWRWSPPRCATASASSMRPSGSRMTGSASSPRTRTRSAGCRWPSACWPCSSSSTIWAAPTSGSRPGSSPAPTTAPTPTACCKEADEAMWRARAVGQPVGVGPLQALQDR